MGTQLKWLAVLEALIFFPDIFARLQNIPMSEMSEIFIISIIKFLQNNNGQMVVPMTA